MSLFFVLFFFPELTFILLTLFESLEDVDEGEVVSFRVLELHAALGCLWLQLHSRNHEARGR